MSRILLICSSTGGALIKQIGLDNVAATKTLPLTQLQMGSGWNPYRCDGIQVGTLRERVLRIVHNGVKIVGQ